jgi:hypothetical protein
MQGEKDIKLKLGDGYEGGLLLYIKWNEKYDIEEYFYFFDCSCDDASKNADQYNYQ